MTETSRLILTIQQRQALPDLVAFAIAGYALMAAHNGPNAKDHPAIAPFIPLIQRNPDALRDASMERARQRYQAG